MLPFLQTVGAMANFLCALGPLVVACLLICRGRVWLRWAAWRGRRRWGMSALTVGGLAAVALAPALLDAGVMDTMTRLFG